MLHLQYVPSGLTFRTSVFWAQMDFMFCTDCKTNSFNSLEKHCVLFKHAMNAYVKPILIVVGAVIA